MWICFSEFPIYARRIKLSGAKAKTTAHNMFSIYSTVCGFKYHQKSQKSVLFGPFPVPSPQVLTVKSRNLFVRRQSAVNLLKHWAELNLIMHQLVCCGTPCCVFVLSISNSKSSVAQKARYIIFTLQEALNKFLSSIIG